MREYTEQHIIELIKKYSKNSGGGGGGDSSIQFWEFRTTPETEIGNEHSISFQTNPYYEITKFDNNYQIKSQEEYTISEATLTTTIIETLPELITFLPDLKKSIDNKNFILNGGQKTSDAILLTKTTDEINHGFTLNISGLTGFEWTIKNVQKINDEYFCTISCARPANIPEILYSNGFGSFVRESQITQVVRKSNLRQDSATNFFTTRTNVKIVKKIIV